MIETNWATAHDPTEMLEALRTTSNERRLWGYVLRCLSGVGADAEADLLQAYIAGSLDEASLYVHRHELEMTAGQRSGGSYSAGRKPVSITKPAQRARATLAAFQTSAWKAADRVTQETRHELQRLQCAWLRCLFANPNGAAVVDAAWLSSTVTELVRMIDEEGRRELMPILGDALIDAGCDNLDLIQHCQSSEAHDRDCWVLALLLGRA